MRTHKIHMLQVSLSAYKNRGHVIRTPLTLAPSR